jgi:hypothetical protein
LIQRGTGDKVRMTTDGHSNVPKSNQSGFDRPRGSATRDP